MLQAIAKNKPLTIATLVLAMVLVIYFAGRKAGKNAEKQSFWNKIFGTEDIKQVEIKEVTVNGQPANDNVQTVTDAIYTAFQPDINLLIGGWFSDAEVNAAFSLFNVLGTMGKGSVINDWNKRYAGTDRPGWGTGNYSTLRQEITRTMDVADLEPQIAIAYKWMQDNNIN